MKLKNILFLMCAFSILTLIDDIFYFTLFSDFINIIVHILQIMIVLLFCKKNLYAIRKYFKKPLFSWSIGAAIIGILIMFSVDGIEITSLAPGVSKRVIENNEHTPLYLVCFITFASFIAPVIEEIEFRGLLLTGLYSNSKQFIFSLILSSLMFMIIHTGVINLSAFVLSIISGVVFYITGNLTYSVIMHFSGNFLVCVMIVYSMLFAYGEKSVLENNYFDITEESAPIYQDIFFCLLIFVIVVGVVFNMYLSARKTGILYDKQSDFFKTNVLEKDKLSNVRIVAYSAFYFVVCTMSTLIQFKI